MVWEERKKEKKKLHCDWTMEWVVNACSVRDRNRSVAGKLCELDDKNIDDERAHHPLSCSLSSLPSPFVTYNTAAPSVQLILVSISRITYYTIVIYDDGLEISKLPPEDIISSSD